MGFCAGEFMGHKSLELIPLNINGIDIISRSFTGRNVQDSLTTSDAPFDKAGRKWFVRKGTFGTT